MGKFTEFKLALASMPQGRHHVEYHLAKQFFVNMESEDIHDADLKVEVDVDHSRDAYDMTFHITGTVTLICDRCLDTMQQPIDANYHIIVKYGDSYNDESDELLVIPQSDAALNVAYMIYDTVVLSIPIKHVHPLGKCNRQMTAMLRKHRATGAADPDEEQLEEELVESIDDAEAQTDAATDTGETVTDPRWDQLKKLKDNN